MRIVIIAVDAFEQQSKAQQKDQAALQPLKICSNKSHVTVGGDPNGNDGPTFNTKDGDPMSPPTNKRV